MKEQIIRAPVRLTVPPKRLYQGLLEHSEGVGLANGGIMWDISTEIIPAHLRKIGSRFIVQYTPPSPEEMNDVDAIRAKNIVEIQELSE